VRTTTFWNNHASTKKTGKPNKCIADSKICTNVGIQKKYIAIIMHSAETPMLILYISVPLR
jgi:hypothetical protein